MTRASTIRKATVKLENYDMVVKMELSEDQVEALRAQTPGVASRDQIHFNNAGCSLPSEDTIKAVINYLNMEAIKGG